MAKPTIIATGFVADHVSLASTFPSAGGDSSESAFQAVYWRCIAVFAFSSRLFNREAQTVVFSNVAPPSIDGIDLAALFTRLGVKTVRLDLTHRLPRDAATKWGNVFYVLDILRYAWAHEPKAVLTLFDSDIVFTGGIQNLGERLKSAAFACYPVIYPGDKDVNGLSAQQGEVLAIARRGGAPLPRPYRHYGGELFGADVAASSAYREAIEALWLDALAHAGEPASIATEEHFWSVLFAAGDVPIAQADDIIKRMWTSPRFNNVTAGDERLPAWHLPAEKRYGFQDMFVWLRAHAFDLTLDPNAFRVRAGRAFGIPRKSVGKLASDTGKRILQRIAR